MGRPDAYVEGKLDRGEVLESASIALRWAQARSDVVMLTGDTTDTGSDEEWQLYRSLVDSLAQESRARLVVIPGNHDLSFTLEYDPAGASKYRLDYEQRSAAFVSHVLVDCPQEWKIFQPSKTSIKQLLEARRAYFDVYRQHPPFEELRHMGLGVSMRSARAPDKLVEAAREQVADGFPWPSADRPFMIDLLDEVYPMLFFETDEIAIIGLNSCTVPAETVIGGAYGRLGKRQLKRLREAAKTIRSPVLAVLVHHHIGVPNAIKQKAFRFHKRAELRAIQLTDAKRFVKLLKSLDSRVIVFYGHKHVGYHAETGGILAIAAPSVSCGDLVSGDLRATLYGLARDGDFGVVEELRLGGHELLAAVNSGLTAVSGGQQPSETVGTQEETPLTQRMLEGAREFVAYELALVRADRKRLGTARLIVGTLLWGPLLLPISGALLWFCVVLFIVALPVAVSLDGAKRLLLLLPRPTNFLPTADSKEGPNNPATTKPAAVENPGSAGTITAGFKALAGGVALGWRLLNWKGRLTLTSVLALLLLTVGSGFAVGIGGGVVLVWLTWHFLSLLATLLVTYLSLHWQ